MKAVAIKDGVYWVGAKNPDLRVFDIVMTTECGTTYNAYLVVGEKVALVETVKSGFEEELLSRVASVLPPEQVDYIIMNHTEPDHSGALGKLLEKMPGATVVASKVALKFLREMINEDFPQMAVADGDQLDLGGKRLTFISAPFLHWPDSMLTYLKDERLLFTCDVFGCHYSGEDIFNDLAGEMEEAFRYYFDVIMSPFSGYVLEALNKIKRLDFNIIAPSHGPVLRENVPAYVEKYARWAAGSTARPAGRTIIVAYVSAYGNTKNLAAEMAAGISEAGAEARLVDLSVVSPAEVAGMVNSADGLLVGSPTLNRDAVYPVWDFLARLSPVINQGKPAAAFGSYGWSGEAVKLIEQRLSGLQFKVHLPGLKVNFTPDKRAKDGAREFGRSFAEQLVAKRYS
ncbi:MAG: lactamase [Peptococcaceae bacterium BICA1-7]|nr:MAG: lactamase [Peptococcaceae bacterium BICA1-7]HBV96562.1 MBL fold metallo-hydrolase [Desulfotomaculum sp.]